MPRSILIDCSLWFSPCSLQVTSTYNETRWTTSEEDIEPEPDAVTLLSILLVGEGRFAIQFTPPCDAVVSPNMINLPWLQTSKNPIVSYLSLFAGVFLSLLIFLSVAGNILVCIAIYTERSLRRIGNLFLASLAIADLFVASLVMTFAGVNDLLGNLIAYHIIVSGIMASPSTRSQRGCCGAHSQLSDLISTVSGVTSRWSILVKSSVELKLKWR